MASQRRARLLASIVSVVGLIGWSAGGWARVNPLTAIEHQIPKPNMLVLLDTSTSMFGLPGGDDLDFSEAGIDCDDGDAHCRTVGVTGRCMFTASGKFGPGVRHDYKSCTTDAQCNDVAYCKSHAPTGCRDDDDCSSSESCTGNICTGGSPKACSTNADCNDGEPCAKIPNNYCVKVAGAEMRLKMCRLAGTMCTTDAHCLGIAGDSCGPASSRMVIAKRVLGRVVQEFRDSVNFGFMTFSQKNYFPYYEVLGGLTTTTQTRFLGRVMLETASPSCFSTSTGPAASCSINGVTYTRQAASNSRYRLNAGGYFFTADHSWGAEPGCGVECAVPGVGTGIYEGSYYTFPYATAASVSSSATTFGDYVGRTRVSGGSTYVYWDPPSEQKNIDDVYSQIGTNPFSNAGTCKGIWDATRWPFMDTSKALPAANAIEMARKITLLTDKVGLGGVFDIGSTPIGDALKGSGVCTTPADSAYHYIKQVQALNAGNGVACRPSAVLLVTDGLPSESTCAEPDCALSPPGPSCTCLAVLSAHAIEEDLDAKVYVMGFSGAVATTTYSTTVTNNIARAGGTTGAYFAISEDQLYQGITSAIYEAARGSYSTSPLTGGTSSNGVSTVLLDARADFPEWRGHLISYDVSGASTVVAWDAASYFDDAAYPGGWKSRNVWTSQGKTMIKLGVDGAGSITNAAKLRELGLGATDAEAALAARWLLGDPALRNPAVLGAMINSSPIDVSIAGGPSLTYVGASDGMLHAFHSKTQLVGGVSYPGGKEAFAYIPEDMLPVIRRLFAQGGQRPAPRDHVFGLANSPKVKRICTANCTGAGTATYSTVLVMPEGFGGNDLFALDIAQPHGSGGILSDPATPPVQLLWNTETTLSLADRTQLDAALGKTISLPAFFFAKSATMDDQRLVFASGYTDLGSSAQGLTLVAASASTGAVKGSVNATGIGGGCAKAPIDPTEPTMLSDVAVARRFSVGDSERIAAAYVGDTWGNLFRWVPPSDGSGDVVAGSGSMTAVESFTCSHPLHLPPTVVQLDRYDASKSPGGIFIAQLTNSALDPVTVAESAAWPASQLIIRKDIAQAGGVVADPSFAAGVGRIALSAATAGQICADYVASTSTCNAGLPAGSRPLSSAMGILKADFDGFVLAALWYHPDSGGCNKGQTYLTVHEVSAVGVVTQLHGEKIGDEPVNGVVFAAGKLYITRSDGPHAVNVAELKPVVATVSTGDRYRRTGWVELP
jgi:hypothetical protein